MDSAPLSPEPATPPALPQAPLEKVCEFPDKLSPMLVKELRQGLRTHTFVTVFLTLQGILTIVLLVSGSISAATDSTGAGSVVSKVVFCFYGLAILVVQPLRGISSLSSEIKGNTIDLMVLTRLSAWRIVWGKWSCLVSQSALILLAVLPYLIFRYFFGGMQLVSEIFLLFYAFVISAILTALAIGISALGSGLIRGLTVVIGGGFLLWFVLWVFTPHLDIFVSALSLASTDTFLLSLGVLVLAVYLGYFSLEIATSFVAPAAENRSTRKRLIGLAVALLGFIAVQFYDLTFAVIAAGVVGMLLAFDAFSENSEFPSSVTRPFLRRGAAGRLLGRFLYPGWATASLFILAFGIILALATFISGKTKGADEAPWIALAIVLGVMVFPAAMIQLCARKSDSRHNLYLGVAAIAWLLTLILGFLYSVVPEDLLFWVFCPIPMAQAPMTGAFWDTGSRDTLVLIPWITTTMYWLIVFAGAAPVLKKLNQCEEEELAREESNDA